MRSSPNYLCRSFLSIHSHQQGVEGISSPPCSMSDPRSTPPCLQIFVFANICICTYLYLHIFAHAFFAHICISITLTFIVLRSHFLTGSSRTHSKSHRCHNSCFPHPSQKKSGYGDSPLVSQSWLKKFTTTLRFKAGMIPGMCIRCGRCHSRQHYPLLLFQNFLVLHLQVSFAKCYRFA